MQWQDEGVVVGMRRQGEGSVLLELMTREHGRHFGFVRGGRSARLQPVLQQGNSVQAVWRARLDEQLGTYTVEGTTLRAARLMGSPAALYGIALLGSWIRLLPERDPHPALHDALVVVADALDDPLLAAPLVVRFELALLAELGFGLALEECAATGSRDDLVYVSPRSARAVSARAGEPYRDRLLALPAFLCQGQGRTMPTPADIAAGFALTGHFLTREVLEPRGIPMPDARAAFMGAVGKAG
jgi:DNA repair protein RecO (recombination protein O)